MLKSSWCITAVLTIGAVLITGCSVFEDASDALEIKPSGTIITEEPTLADFDRVRAASAFDVALTQGDTFAVTLRVDENVHEHLDVHVDGDTLYLKLKDRDGGYNLRDKVTMEATITMPHLRAVGLSGASTGTVAGFASESALDVQLSGASRLTGEISAGIVDVAASGASRVELSGRAEALTLDLSGASKALLYAFTVSGDADIRAGGASRAEVFVNGTLNIDASGASQVLYQGDASLGEVKESGESSVEAGS